LKTTGRLAKEAALQIQDVEKARRKRRLRNELGPVPVQEEP